MSVLAGLVRVADKEENYIITNSFIGVIEPPFTLGNQMQRMCPFPLFFLATLLTLSDVL